MADIRLMTLDPGHFHAALVQKETLVGVSPAVHIYAPLGFDLYEHLKRIAGFNNRKDNPTHWDLEIHATADPLARMLREKPGNVVVIAGRNQGKIDRIKTCVENGLNALVDKPWVITAADFPKLEATLNTAEAKKLVAYDIAATGDENEHVWYDLPGVGKVADQVAARLGELQPASKQAFTDNAAAFKAKVDELEKRLGELGAAHPGTKVVVTEPVAHYLLKSAKLTDATPKAFSDAVENDTDVPAGAVNEYKQLIATKQVKALINNAQTVTPLTQDVVGQAKAAGIGVVDVTETLPQGVTDYIGWMTGEVDALAGALK